MVEQAIRNGWDLPERTLADLPARLLEIIVSRDGEDVDRCAVMGYAAPHEQWQAGEDRQPRS